MARQNNNSNASVGSHCGRFRRKKKLYSLSIRGYVVLGTLIFKKIVCRFRSDFEVKNHKPTEMWTLVRSYSFNARSAVRYTTLDFGFFSSSYKRVYSVHDACISDSNVSSLWQFCRIIEPVIGSPNESSRKKRQRRIKNKRN